MSGFELDGSIFRRQPQFCCRNGPAPDYCSVRALPNSAISDGAVTGIAELEAGDGMSFDTIFAFLRFPDSIGQEISPPPRQHDFMGN